jgi:archaellum component FlaG (FlaF/FlaG flagellin family)
MKEQIQLIYRPTDLKTSNIVFRLISEAANTETNGEETEDLKLYIKNEGITVKNFLSRIIVDGMAPVFIF